MTLPALYRARSMVACVNRPGQEEAMRVPATIRWLGLALLGILIAAAVSIAASRLASQQIGLASQPISAGDALAPAVSRARPKQRHPGQPPASHQTTTSTEPSTVPGSPPTSSEPPTTYSPPPYEPSQSPSHDGEHNGAGRGADD